MGEKKKIFLLSIGIMLMTVVPFCAKAQNNNQLVNSADLLRQGIDLSDSGNYDKAVALYEQISRNDTNYPLALFEEAISLLSNNKDSQAIALCQKGLELHTEYQPDFYKFMAGGYIDLEKYDEAIKLMHTAIARYPNVYLLYYTLGLAQYKAKHYDSAIVALEKSINLNQFHASSHFYLAECCLEQGRVIPAVLSLQFCLVLEPLSSRSFPIVQLLEKVTENKYDYDKANKVPVSQYNDGVFADVDLLVQSQAALNKGYKAESKINYNIIKQCQVVYDKINYVANSNNFWMDTYVPFFIEMRKQDMFRPYAAYIMQSVNDPDIQKEVKKEKKKIDQFIDFADKQILAMRHTRTMPIDGKPTLVTCYYYSNRLFQAVGQENSASVQFGPWTIYNETTGNVAAKGSFDNDGKRDGTWLWYYQDSTLKERTTYSHGSKEGNSEVWYENGAPKGKYLYKNDKLNGEATEYNSSGIIYTHGTYKDDNPDTTFTIYYANGKPHYILNYGDNVMRGEQKEVYVTGQLKLSSIYQDGKKNGPATDYWPNGKIKDQGSYADGDATGHWKFYFEDGNLEKEFDYDKGNTIGTGYIYYRNGKKEEEMTYDKDGKLDGSNIQYDEDGIKYVQFDYKKDEVNHYQYFDKTGKVIAEGALSGNRIHFDNYYPDGTKESVGDYVDNKREGEWKFYSVIGTLSSLNNYSAGLLSGETIDYFDSGIVKDSVNYTSDQMDGHYRSYNEYGVLKSEGWYVNGQAQGDWYYYNAKGGLSSHYYYLGGNTHGYTESYTASGRLTEEDFYNNLGYFDKAWMYDSTGKNVDYTYISDKGNGHFQSKYPNGQIKLDRNYVSGNVEGHQKLYYYDGKVWADGDLMLEKRQGTYRLNYDNGNPQSEYNYIAGELDGPSTTFYRDGKKHVTDNYIGDEENGHYAEYFDKGNLRRDGESVDGKSEGDYNYYSADSLLYCIRKYKHDFLVAYSYPGKDGKPVPYIPVVKGSCQMQTYFANGNKSMECTYVNGEVEGKRTEYFSNGHVYQDENYKAGDLMGAQKYYYANGNLSSEENYYMGKRDGHCVYYYDNGKMQSDENWILGDRQGIFKFYDRSGKLIKTVVYYNDDEVSETKS